MNIEEDLINHYGCEDKKDLQAYLGDFVSIEMIKSFGVLCYNQALEDASEKATATIYDSYMEGDCGDDLYSTSNEDKDLCLSYYEDIQEQGTKWAYKQLEDE